MKVCIVGYGRIGRAVEQECIRSADIELCGIVSRRAQSGAYSKSAPVISVRDAQDLYRSCDVALICLGSSVGLTEAVTGVAKHTNTIDVYDDHGRVREHRAAVNGVARAYEHTSAVCTGWDPGLLSVIRAYCGCLVGDNVTTYWGEGISRGHTEALKRIDGVINAVELTVPDENAMRLTALGAFVAGNIRHNRLCYIHIADEKKKDCIKNAILDIDGYFKGQNVTVSFVDEARISALESDESHRGRVVISGQGGDSVFFDLNVCSNSETTARIALAYARAAVKMNRAGIYGAFSPAEIAPSFLFEDDEYLSLL